MQVSIKLSLETETAWLSHIELTRIGDEILFEVKTTKGFSSAEYRMSTVDFNNMADMLLTAPVGDV